MNGDDNTEDGKRDYEVGYGRPPRKNQFGGPQGNPRYRGGSRKRKSASLADSFDKVLRKKVRMKSGDEEHDTDLFDGVLMRIGADALAGKRGATVLFFQLLRERQSLEQSADEHDDSKTDDLAIIEAYLKSRGGGDDAE